MPQRVRLPWERLDSDVAQVRVSARVSDSTLVSLKKDGQEDTGLKCLYLVWRTAQLRFVQVRKKFLFDPPLLVRTRQGILKDLDSEFF